MGPLRAMDLRCPRCGWVECCLREAMVARLKSAGMLRRNIDPSWDEVRELFKAVAARMACPRCSAGGLAAVDSPDDDAAWPGGAPCEACGKTIDPERLEALPNARLCAACQASADRGADSGPAEYCPRCGSVMVVRQSRGSGIARSVQSCPACRR